MKTITLDFKHNVYLIGEEKVNIHFKEIRYIERSRNKNKIGELFGYIDIVYPFAGLDLNITLEIFTGLHEDIESLDGFIKIPFAKEKLSVWDLYEAKDLKDMEEKMEYNNEICSCGGYMLPMYDEFPNWIKFCNKCDRRYENIDYSPLPY